MSASRSPATVERPPALHASPVAVTGGAGLLGREVVRQLTGEGCIDVRVVDVQAATFPAGGPVSAYGLDILRHDLATAFAGAKTVFHLAACQYHSPLAATTYRLPFEAVNVEGTRRALAAARQAGAQAFVHVSSSMVYGRPQHVPMREDHPRQPLGPYGGSKLRAEILVEEASARGLATAIVRPGPIFGPGRLGAITRLFDDILTGRPITLIGQGENRQDLVTPEDCARLVVRAAPAAAGHAVYNCGSAAVPTMREWLRALIEDAGSRSEFRAAPAAAAKAGLRLLEMARLAPVRREQYAIADLDYWLDTSAARQLGWVPLRSGVDAALAMFRWYRARRPPWDTRGGGATSALPPAPP